MELSPSDEIYAALQRIVSDKRGASLVPEAPPLLSARWSQLRPLEDRLNEFAARPWVDLSDVPIRSRNPLILFLKRLVLKSTYWLFHPLFGRISQNSALLAQFSRFTLDELRQLAIDVDSLNKQFQRAETFRPGPDVNVTVERLSRQVAELERRLAYRDAGPHHAAVRNALSEAGGGEIIEIASSGVGILTDSLARSGFAARAIQPAALGAVGDHSVGALVVVDEVAAMRGDLLWLLVQTALRKLRPSGMILFESAVSTPGGVRPAAIAQLLETSGFRDVHSSNENGKVVVRAKR